MRIEIAELKPPATAAEMRACVAGMGHVIFHFQREAAYMFLHGGRDSEEVAERLRDMCTELMLKAAELVTEALKLEAEEARVAEIREEAKFSARQ
jgi:hypothetical protein